jgi:hypothetical protein
MPFVSVRLSDGLGNRFFQIAALLGYAEKHGHTPILVDSWIEHNKSHPGPKTIKDFFPDISVYYTPPEGDWKIYKEDGANCFTYVDIPYCPGHVKLEGCFQSEKYFPSQFSIPKLLQNYLWNATNVNLENAVFLHVRRGDYLNPYCAHHHVDLGAYYRRALACVGRGPVVVCSDDIPWCKSVLPTMYSDLVWPQEWIFLEGLSDYETLAVMTRCGRGAITANSTFSWWGAYWGVAKRYAWFFPDTWGHPPLPSARDIYPAGATVVPCTLTLHKN